LLIGKLDNTLHSYLSDGKSMGRILFSIFLSIGILSGPAFGSTPAGTTPSELKPATVAALTLQPVPDHANINASYRPETAQPVAMNSVGSQADKADTGWRYLGTLLATLVLIGAIAVRRHTAGKH
jgi:hypothetical protein